MQRYRDNNFSIRSGARRACGSLQECPARHPDRSDALRAFAGIGASPRQLQVSEACWSVSISSIRDATHTQQSVSFTFPIAMNFLTLSSSRRGKLYSHDFEISHRIHSAFPSPRFKFIDSANDGKLLRLVDSEGNEKILSTEYKIENHLYLPKETHQINIKIWIETEKRIPKRHWRDAINKNNTHYELVLNILRLANGIEYHVPAPPPKSIPPKCLCKHIWNSIYSQCDLWPDPGVY